MKGRHLAIALLLFLALAVALIFYLGMTGGGRRDGGTGSDQASPVSFAKPPSSARSSGVDTGAAARLAEERRKRDDLRRAILEAWAKGDTIPAGAEDAKQGRFAQHPNADGYGIEPKYIQMAMREQMFPMISKCYEDLLSRQPDAGGRVQLWFKIVGDDKLGGIVEEDETADGGDGSMDGNFGDEKMRTCVRESLEAVMFPPPGQDGVVTVGYPLILAQTDDEDGGP